MSLVYLLLLDVSAGLAMRGTSPFSASRHERPFWRAVEKAKRYDSAGDEIVRDRFAHPHHVVDFTVVERGRNLRGTEHPNRDVSRKGLFDDGMDIGDLVNATIIDMVSPMDSKGPVKTSLMALSTRADQGQAAPQAPASTGASASPLELIGQGGTIAYLTEVVRKSKHRTKI